MFHGNHKFTRYLTSIKTRCISVELHSVQSLDLMRTWNTLPNSTKNQEWEKAHRSLTFFLLFLIIFDQYGSQSRERMTTKKWNWRRILGHAKRNYSAILFILTTVIFFILLKLILSCWFNDSSWVKHSTQNTMNLLIRRGCLQT